MGLESHFLVLLTSVLYTILQAQKGATTTWLLRAREKLVRSYNESKVSATGFKVSTSISTREQLRGLAPKIDRV